LLLFAHVQDVTPTLTITPIFDLVFVTDSELTQRANEDAATHNNYKTYWNTQETFNWLSHLSDNLIMNLL